MFSEQELIDCSVGEYRDSNNGCDGGFIEASLDYALVNGIGDGYSYPYAGGEGRCRFNRPKQAKPGFNHGDGSVTVDDGLVDYVMINGSEKLMMAAVAKFGPIAAYVEMKHAKSYGGNGRNSVFYSPECTRTKYRDLDHAVLITGYGTTSNGQDYWMVKNSWGTDWGKNGYMMLTRGENHCGIGYQAFVPIMKSASRLASADVGSDGRLIVPRWK